jgi:tight adherence protein B
MPNLSRVLGRTVVLGLLGLLLLAFGAPATAEDTATISHVETTDEGLQVLVSVPAGTEVELDQVSVTISGKPATSTAAPASAAEALRRTAVLAIDTSQSMHGARFAAAKAAANAYLDAVPDNVYVGIVTFDSTVDRALEPTLDRDAARSTIDGLALAKETLLYDGLLEAVDMAGKDGQASVLVLSDGRDTSQTQIVDVTAAITAAGVLVEAVALDQSAQDSGPLQAMATAGKGKLITADTNALRETFAAEADALARQVLVTAQIPDGVTASEGQVAVSLPAGSSTLQAQAFVPIQNAGQKSTPAASPDGPLVDVSHNVMLVGLGAFGVGFLGMIVGVAWMSSAKPAAQSAEDRISQHTGGGDPAGKRKTEKELDLRSQAKSAAAQMLARNQSLEARIAKRLEAAGSALKPAEWFLVHGGIAFGSGVVGALLWGPVGLAVLLLVGTVLPWAWLGRKRKKRLKAFNGSLADTLQLMSGSLSAGLSLAQSVDTIVREGNEPVTSEFKRVLVEARLGVHLEEALAGVSDRMESKDFSWVVMAIRIQREVGGNLAELLNNVSATLREREYLRRQVNTLSAEGRLSAWILGGLPPVFTLYLVLTKPGYVTPLFTTPIGWAMTGGAVVLLSTGCFWMSKVVKVDV